MPGYFAHVNAKRVCYGPKMFLKSNDLLWKSGAGERNKQSPSQMAAAFKRFKRSDTNFYQIEPKAQSWVSFPS